MDEGIAQLLCQIMHFLPVFILDIFLDVLSYMRSLLCISSQMALFIAFGFLSMCLAVILNKKKLGVVPLVKIEYNEQLLNKTKEKIQEYKFPPRKLMKHSSLISRNVDDVIDELIKLLLRDYINSWYGNIVKEHSSFINDLKPLIREMLFTFRNRCQKIDDVKLFTSDFVNIINKHLQRVRNAAINPPDRAQPYRVYPHLESKERELEYLRRITEYLLITLLPTNYVKVLPLRHLLREIFASSVFYNLIDKLTDPDSINQRLIMYLKNQQIAAEKHGRTYAYAETYEDFIKMIQECGSIEALQQMRYYIVTEIMQATTISNVKRSKGMDVDKEFNTQKTNKGDLLQSRNLSRYLNQLRYAKGQCEKRVKFLGGPDFMSSPRGSSDSSLEDKITAPGRKVLSMAVIMQSPFCRPHFSKFLQKDELHSLLGFWEAVEEMKHSDKTVWHQLGNDIVRMYIHNQASSVHLSKNTLKGIEEFMMANKGPDAFFQAQEEVYKQLEENSYASFIVSDIYHKMLALAEKQGIDFVQGLEENNQDSMIANASRSLEKSDDAEISVFDHSSYARTQLKALQAKLNDKILALAALRSNPKCDKKMTLKLEQEIENLCSEQRMLENHIEKTELWIKYLGLWQATIVQGSVVKENDKTVPYFNVMVHLSNDAGPTSGQTVGWVVTRSLNSFHTLLQKLVPAAIWLKKIELPTKPRFKSLDKAYLEKAKSSLQTFLSAVTKDDDLNKSEALYSFLSPSPEHMKHPACPSKKPFKFNLMQIFRGVQNLGAIDEPEEEELLFLDDTDSKEDNKDSIAEPLYTLIGEIFELKGVSNWLRRTLIIFVQLTYGRTINRQLRETVSGIMAEPMLLSYLQMFRDSMWPTGQINKPAPPIDRTDEQKFETKRQAKKMLLDSIPELLNNLVGQQNARKGITKLFDALQDKTLNKHLLYNIVEAFLYEYSPDLRRRSSIRSDKQTFH